MKRQILVATDGGAGSMGALRLALALSRRGLVPREVITVEEPAALYNIAGPGALEEAELTLEREAARERRRMVEEQLRELGPEAADWKVRVEVGPPASTIAEAAREGGDALILVGLGRHELRDRWFGGETALRVMQLAEVPVLAVHPDTTGLPERAVVAEDFSAFSEEAGRWAMDLLDPGGELHLAHVVQAFPPVETEFLTSDWFASYLEGVQKQLDAKRTALATTFSGEIWADPLKGEPAPEILRLAGKIDADLIAAGRHGRGFLGRLLIGSVSARLVRRARCSVLIVPGPADE